jgi:hypothetical protein
MERRHVIRVDSRNHFIFGLFLQWPSHAALVVSHHAEEIRQWDVAVADLPAHRLQAVEQFVDFWGSRLRLLAQLVKQHSCFDAGDFASQLPGGSDSFH